MKTQKTKPRKQTSKTVLPLWVREKGIATQKELVMALLPYMEWYPRVLLKKRFVDIVISKEKFSCILKELREAGLVEVKYGETPITSRPELKPKPYAYYRRLARKCPRVGNAWKTMLDGTRWINGAQKRAAEAMKPLKQKPKTTMKNLTLDDLRYIQSNPAGMNDRELGEFMGVNKNWIREIKLKNYVPAHLRVQLAQSRIVDNQVET